MELPLGRHRGGIAGLLTLSREEWQAIEADLLAKGKTRSQIGTPELPWTALVAMVKFSPPGSALYIATHGDPWTYTDHLLADLSDFAAWLAWSKSKAAQQNRDQPKPRPRPGQKRDDGQTFGSAETAVATTDFQSLWDERMALIRAAHPELELANRGGSDGA